MQRSSVDLPAPDGPMMQTTSPRGTDSETSVSTSSRPNDFQMRSSRTIGAAPSGYPAQFTGRSASSPLLNPPATFASRISSVRSSTRSAVVPQSAAPASV